jgi:adenylate kinase family enzyme
VAAPTQAFEADRIVVVGCAGSGKSTLAAVLAARLNAPHIRRDWLGLEGSDEYRRGAEKAVSRHRWVFDGAPYYLEQLVYGRAELIVAFDLSCRVVMRRVISRSLHESLGWTPAPPHRDRRWRAWLNPEHPVRWAWSTWSDRRREVADLRDQTMRGRAAVVSLSTPRGAAAWLDQRIHPGWSLWAPRRRQPSVDAGLVMAVDDPECTRGPCSRPGRAEHQPR